MAQLVARPRTLCKPDKSVCKKVSVRSRLGLSVAILRGKIFQGAVIHHLISKIRPRLTTMMNVQYTLSMEHQQPDGAIGSASLHDDRVERESEERYLFDPGSGCHGCEVFLLTLFHPSVFRNQNCYTAVIGARLWALRVKVSTCIYPNWRSCRWLAL